MPFQLHKPGRHLGNAGDIRLRHGDDAALAGDIVAGLGFKLVATEGTARTLQAAGPAGTPPDDARTDGEMEEGEKPREPSERKDLVQPELDGGH